MVVALIDHEIVSVWFPVLINRFPIVLIDLASILTSFQLRSCPVIDSSRDCSRVVPIDSQ